MLLPLSLLLPFGPTFRDPLVCICDRAIAFFCVACHSFSWLAMSRWQDKKRKISQDGCTILRIWPDAHLSKRTLQPYVQNFSPVYLPKGVSERKKYKLNEFRKALDADSSELCRRLPFGLSMTASSMAEMSLFLQENQEDVKTTIDALKTMFDSEIGTSFYKALATMNSKVPDFALNAEEAVAAWWAFMKDDADNKQKTLREALMASSRIYLGAHAMLECLALADQPSEWAQKIDPVRLQAKAVRAWKKDPESESKARSAMEQTLRNGQFSKAKSSESASVTKVAPKRTDTMTGKARKKPSLCRAVAQRAAGRSTPSSDVPAVATTPKQAQSKVRSIYEAGLTKEDAREQLKADGYKKARISQLLKDWPPHGDDGDNATLAADDDTKS